MNNQKTYPDTIWGVRNIAGTPEELLSELEKKELYRPVLRQMKLEKRKMEWLSVRLLLKELLGEEKEVEYDNAGKPFLKDRSFHIGISHTAGYVAVILNPNRPVGIDIEQVAEQVVRLRKRFLSEKEQRHISKEKELIHLLLHWSAKETMFKALGEEEVIFKEQLHINPFDPQIGILSTFSSFESRTGRKTEFLIRYVVNPEYVLTFTEL
ncbi:MAG: 4'-phosphopantetheinyl transferase superfamily protein [Dysgonamonadaceae bacterium]|jgi:phosphopantetheinyl transferase|nr:4'-phosphopantetheinyl transferase superfamily protein [Dysgonamonadaceae bacterium]